MIFCDINEQIELTNKNISDLSFVNVVCYVFVGGNPGGAEGNVYIFTIEQYIMKIYEGNIYSGKLSMDDVNKLIPDCKGDGHKDKLDCHPNGWKFIPYIIGHYVYVRDYMADRLQENWKTDDSLYYFDKLCKSICKTCRQYEARIFSDDYKKATHEDRINIFHDTLAWIEEDEELTQSVIKAKKATTVYYEDDYPAFDKSKKYDTVISVVSDRSFQAAMILSNEMPESKIAVLNFANAYHAGGGVEKGSSAQEESLCRTSTLYPLLYRKTLHDSFYKHNIEHRNITGNTKATDSLIYTEGVVIIKTDGEFPRRMKKEDWVTVDVITMAAPDLRYVTNIYAPLNGNATSMDGTELFAYHFKRAIHMLTVAAAKGVDVLVLGAFGCGAFKNDPIIVAKAYKQALQVFPKVFKRVEFAIYRPTGGSRNYDVFKKIMDDKKG